MKGHRVEEIIFYRFDRLDAQSQMLLKMGAVTCATGSGYGFSLEMLASMLQGNDKILNIFLDGGNSYSDKNSSDKSRLGCIKVDKWKQYFTFRIGLERTIIYDLERAVVPAAACVSLTTWLVRSSA